MMLLDQNVLLAFHHINVINVKKVRILISNFLVQNVLKNGIIVFIVSLINVNNVSPDFI